MDGTKVRRREKRSDLIKVHQQLGHPSEDPTRTTGLKMELKMKGLMKYCEGFGMGKIRQKAMGKETVIRAEKIGKKMLMDIGSITHESAGGAKF